MYDPRPGLPAFALYLEKPVWIGAAPISDTIGRDVVWNGRGPEDVPILALQNGFVIFEFDKSSTYAGGDIPPHDPIPSGTPPPPKLREASLRREELAFARVGYMNAFLKALNSGYSMIERRAQPVQPPVSLDNYYIAVVEAAGWQFFNDLAPKLDFPRVRNHILKLETLDYAIQSMEACRVAFGNQFIKVLELTYVACHQYERHQFSSAHAIAWTVVEHLIFILWDRFQRDADSATGGHTKFNADRRKLLEGRDYSASVVIQFLSLANRIDDDILQRLNEARRTRNAFVHSLAEVQARSSGDVIRLATDLTAKIANIRFTSQLSYSYHL